MTTPAPIRLEYHSASTAIVSLHGDLGRNARGALAAALGEAGGRAAVVVDVSRAEHVDPSLVNALQQAAEHVIGAPARLELVIPAGAHALRSLFETVGASTVATVHATRAAALSALAQETMARPRRHAA
jgi:ABC-type transporter Mla MlaB component